MSRKRLVAVATVFAVLLGGCASDGYGGGYEGGSSVGHAH